MESKFSGWCFQHPGNYFPFPGAEKFVPARTENAKNRRSVFPWGFTPPQMGPFQETTQFINHRAGPLCGKLKQIHYWKFDGVFEKCVFSFSPGQTTGDVFIVVYAVRADGSHFVDKVGMSDIYLATRLADIQRAFPELKF